MISVLPRKYGGFTANVEAGTKSEIFLIHKLSTEWTKVSFDAPQVLAARFRDNARTDVKRRAGKVNLSGTAALGLWTALPPEIRRGMIRWAQDVEDDPRLAEDPAAALEIFVTIMKTLFMRPLPAKDRPPDPAETESRWFVDRILTPEVLKAREQSKKVG